MLNFIWILLSRVVALNYEIWKIDIKKAFLNDYFKENVYMVQLKGFTVKGQERKVYKVKSSIYGLKQESKSWNLQFDETIKIYGFE